jgi:hypothetical protein
MSSARVPFILALFLLLVSHIIAGVLPSPLPVCDILDSTLPFIPGFSSSVQPPEAILTTDISPECEDKNNGTLVCCGQEVNGGTFPVAELAEYCHYPLPDDTINGVIDCASHIDPRFSAGSPAVKGSVNMLTHRNDTGLTDETSCEAPLCCQVITLVSLIPCYPIQ